MTYLAGQKSGACPPLSQDEVLALRGQPVAKVVLEQGKLSLAAAKEEWVYIMDNGAKEHFLFAKGCLVGWHNE